MRECIGLYRYREYRGIEKTEIDKKRLSNLIEQPIFYNIY